MEITFSVERPGLQYDEPSDTYVESGDYAEITVTVTGSVSRCRPATRWDPAEGGEVEIEEVVDQDGNDIELTDAERETAEQLLGEEAADDDGGRADYEYDCAKDRRAEGDY